MQTSLFMQRYDEADFLYTQIQLNGGFKYEKALNWVADKKDLVERFYTLDPVILRHDESNLESHTITFKLEECIGVIIITKRKNITVRVSSSKDRNTAVALAKKIQNVLTIQSGASDKDILVNFWHTTSQGARSTSRKIDAPKWKEIQHNYSESTRNGLDRLMKFKPSDGGKLILMHGHPGAGKTYSIRALCQEWKSWCNTQYVMDPERLFGGTDYFSQLILDGEVEYDEEDNLIPSSEKEWRLFILEDTGELLSEDARNRSGQGLSRLLNLVDGFIGQGLRVLVLITTNEELDKLHPAVSRDGRCAASIEFKDFTYEQALVWAKRNNITLPKNKEYSLAELYAILKDSSTIRVDLDSKSTAKKPLGFKMVEATT